MGSLGTSQHASVATSEARGAGHRGEARGLVRRDARWTRDTRVHGERSGVSGASTCCTYECGITYYIAGMCLLFGLPGVEPQA